VVYEVVALDRRVWLRPQCVDLAAIAASRAERVDNTICNDVVVATAACGPAPSPSDGHCGISHVFHVVVLDGCGLNVA
jgi:hypothetical protein